MTGRERGGPHRQMSLDQPPKRPQVRRQGSEEVGPEVRGLGLLWREGGKKEQRPRALKVAWGEQRGVSFGQEEGAVEIVAKKCGQPRPPLAKPPRSPLVPTQKSLLHSRQQLSERLRTAWKQKSKERANLDIFINRASFECDEFSELTTPRTAVSLARRSSLRDAHRERRISFDIPLQGASAFPDTSEEPLSSLVVESSTCENPDAAMAPSGMENTAPPSSESEQSESSEEEAESHPQPPLTARDRRMHFRNAGRQSSMGIKSPPRTPTPTARRPLPRMSSAPPPPTHNRKHLVKNTSMEVSTPEPRVKSAPPKRKIKPVKRKLRVKGEWGDDEDGRKPWRKDKNEVVTMVSLVSPEASDVECETPIPVIQSPPTPQHQPPPPRAPTELPPEKPTPPPILFLRKPPKAVSFKPGGVGVKETWEGSFPLRRGTSLGGANQRLPGHATTPLVDHTPPPSSRPPPTPHRPLLLQPTKKELFRSHTQEPSRFHGEGGKEEEEAIPTEELPGKEEQEKVPNMAEEDEESEVVTPILKNQKEKECWELFKKITNKGVSVSFETVLRGLLTPTEYRLRRAALLSTC